MSYQFVNTSANNRKPDEASRKKIRSQVMRDFRRREQEKRDSASAGTSRLESLTPEAGQASDSSSRPTSLSRSSSQPVSNVLTPPSWVRRRGEDVGSDDDRPKRGRPAKRRQQLKQNLFLQTTHGLFANFTVEVNVPPRPTLPTSSPVGVHVSGEEIEQLRMLDLSEKFHEWLIPEHTTLVKVLTPEGPKEDVAGQMLLYARCLMSIGHLFGLGMFEGDDDERSYFKAKLLALASQRLKNPENALEDSTLAALGCLASYEISYGSDEATTHLNGIARMIEWRGGMSYVGDGQVMPMFLQTLDLLHAVYFATAPIHHLDATDDTFDSESSIQSFEDGLDDVVMGHEWSESTAPSDPRRPSLQQRTSYSGSAGIEQWRDALRRAAIVLQEQQMEEAARASNLASHIMESLTDGRLESTTGRESSTKEEMEWLYRIMLNLPDETWDGYPEVQTRVLLTALATAQDIRHKAWYYAHLSRVMFHTQPQHWDELKNLVLGFIDVQSHLRRAVNETVTAVHVANSDEMMVERALS